MFYYIVPFLNCITHSLDPFCPGRIKDTHMQEQKEKKKKELAVAGSSIHRRRVNSSRSPGLTISKSNRWILRPHTYILVHAFIAWFHQSWPFPILLFSPPPFPRFFFFSFPFWTKWLYSISIQSSISNSESDWLPPFFASISLAQTDIVGIDIGTCPGYEQVQREI